MALAELRDGKLPLIWGQNAGAGRIVWINMTKEWMWNMLSDKSHRGAVTLWKALFQWVSRNEKDRLELSPRSSFLPQEKETRLKVVVLDRNYEIAEHAEVLAEIDYGSDKSETLRLPPSPEGPGIYAVDYQPRQEGVFSVKIRAKLPDGEILQMRREYHTYPQSPEEQPVPQAVETLRTIARTTGARYYDWHNIDAIRKFEPPANVRYRIEKISLTRSWPFVLCLCTLLFLEWWKRRQYGLR